MKVKESIQKVKEFVKKHPCATGFTVFVVGTILIALASGKTRTPKTTEQHVAKVTFVPALPDREFKFDTAKTVEWSGVGDNWISVCIDDISTDNLGKFGEEIAAQIPELITPDSKLALMVNAYDLKKID